MTPDQLTRANLMNFEIERAESAVTQAEVLAEHPMGTSIVRAFFDERIPEHVEQAIRDDVVRQLRAHRDALLEQFAAL